MTLVFTSNLLHHMQFRLYYFWVCKHHETKWWETLGPTFSAFKEFKKKGRSRHLISLLEAEGMAVCYMHGVEKAKKKTAPDQAEMAQLYFGAHPY